MYLITMSKSQLNYSARHIHAFGRKVLKANRKQLIAI